MSITVYKRGFIKIQHQWYEEQYGKSGADIIFIHQANNPMLQNKRYARSSSFLTLISSLEIEENEMLNKIGKNCRYEIRRAEKTGVCDKRFTSDLLLKNTDIINDFLQCYKRMYISKNLNPRISEKLLDSYIQTGVLELSVAEYEGEALAYHVYIKGGKSVRLLYSCSLFRDDKENKNLIGYANKYLHWKDMLYYKGIGIENYDWGGIASLEKPNGIDQFKLTYGGDKHSFYNIIVGYSFVGKVILFLMRIKDGNYIFRGLKKND